MPDDRRSENASRAVGIGETGRKRIAGGVLGQYVGELETAHRSLTCGNGRSPLRAL
jgi:hypothetical protein